MGRLPLLSLLALALLAPSAEAGVCRDWWTAEVSPQTVTYEIGIRYMGDAAAGDRASIDREVGNGDGTVSAAEIRAYEKKWSWSGGALDPSCAARFAFLTVDGRLPRSMVRVEKHMIDATGPTDTTRDLWYRMRLVMDYGPGNDSAIVRARAPEDDAYRLAYGCASTMHTNWWADHPCVPAAGSDAGGRHGYAYAPARGAKIESSTLSPATLHPLWDGTRILAEAPSEEATLRQTVAQFTVTRGPAFPGTATAAIVVGLTVGAVGIAVAAWVWREQLWQALRQAALSVALFTRLERDSAADHPRRQLILSAVKASPGITFNDLGRRTEIPKGALAHHVRMLENMRLLVVQRERFWTRLYLSGAPPPRPPATNREEAVVAALATRPGLTTTELASLVGLERRALHYHLRRLEEVGRVRRDVQQGRVSYYPVADGSTARPQPD